MKQETVKRVLQLSNEIKNLQWQLDCLEDTKNKSIKAPLAISTPRESAHSSVPVDVPKEMQETIFTLLEGYYCKKLDMAKIALHELKEGTE